MEENIEVPNQQIIEESNNSPLGLRIESNENIKELKLENENLKKELESKICNLIYLPELRQENKRLQDLEDQFCTFICLIPIL